MPYPDDLLPLAPRWKPAHRPRAIVFNAKPAVLIGGPDFTQRYWQETLTARELIELFQMMPRCDYFAATLAGRVLPSLRSRLEIRSHLLAALRGDAGPLHEINRALWRNWKVNDGANVVLLQSPYNGELTAKDAQNLHPNAFYADKSNARAIHLFLTLAQQENIPVFLLLPPLSPNLQSAREQSGAAAGLRALHPRLPGAISLHIVDPRRPKCGLSRRGIYRRDPSECPRCGLVEPQRRQSHCAGRRRAGSRIDAEVDYARALVRTLGRVDGRSRRRRDLASAGQGPSSGVLSCRRGSHRLNLSIRQCPPEPFERAESEVP